MSKSEQYKNIGGFAYSNEKWLDQHHAIKIDSRLELINRLPIFSGDHILDIGCGTGLWTILAAEKTGIHGKILGIDIDPESLKIAKQRQNLHILKEFIDFRLEDANNIEVNKNRFDVILLFNVLSYIEDPKTVIENLLLSLRPGGRILIKDTDLQADFFYPIPFDLYSQIFLAILSPPKRLRLGYYDPFFARNIKGILSTILNIRVTTYSQSFSFYHPLSLQEKNYIRGNVALLGSIAHMEGACEVAKRWVELFDEENQKCAFHDKNFMYSMTEFIFQVVPI